MLESHRNELKFVLALTAVVIGIALMGGPYRAPSKYDPRQEFATRVAELQSGPTTEVVVPYGPEGYISHYWSESGLSAEYTLEEYKAAVVPLSKGADVDTPVEGNHFQVPWNK